MRSAKSADLTPFFIFFSRDFLNVVLKGKTKVLPTAIFEFIFFPSVVAKTNVRVFLKYA